MVDPGPRFQKNSKTHSNKSIFGLGYAYTTLTKMCYTQIEVNFETTPYTSGHVTTTTCVVYKQIEVNCETDRPHLDMSQKTCVVYKQIEVNFETTRSPFGPWNANTK